MSDDPIENRITMWMVDPIITRDGTRKLDKLGITHVVNGSGEEPVESLAVTEKSTPKALAATVNAIVDGHARGLAASESATGRESYRLKCIFSDDDGMASGSLALNRTPGPRALTAPGGHTSSEPATPQGQLAQEMRHAEGHNAFIMRALDGIFMTRQDQNEEIISLRKELRELNGVLMQALREEALKTEGAAFKAELVKAAVTLAPTAVNLLTGKDIMPKQSADALLFQSLVEKVRDLDDEKKQALLVALQSILDEKTFAVLIGRLAEGM